jgi:RNase P subunit RPR2
MALHGPWAVEIKKGLAAMTCSKARMFSRHARMLPKHLQDMRADVVIMTCKPCGQALQYHATVQPAQLLAHSRGATV